LDSSDSDSVRHDKRVVYATHLRAAIRSSAAVAVALADATGGATITRISSGLTHDDAAESAESAELAVSADVGAHGELLLAVVHLSAVSAAIRTIELAVVDPATRLPADLRTVGHERVARAYALFRAWSASRGLAYGDARPVPAENASSVLDAFRYLIAHAAAGPSERASHATASARLLQQLERRTIAATDALAWLFLTPAHLDVAAFDLCVGVLGAPLADDVAVVSLLREALGDRVSRVVVRGGGTQVCCVYKQPRCFSIVDRGPTTDRGDDAERFRTLWGDKAELRRFKDGAVVLSVTWSGVARQEVMYACVAHLLALHFNARCAPSLQSAVPLKAIDDATAAAWPAFDRFVGELRALADIPLTLVSAQPIAPLMRYAEARPSGLHASSPPIHVVLRYEASGSWPQEIDAIEAVKQSFYVRIADLLRRQRRYAARACREFVDVVVDQLPLRLYIMQPHQHQLLRDRLAALTASADASLDASVAAEARALGERVRRLDFLGALLPTLSAAILGFARQVASFSDAARMFKTWLSAHMLADQLDEYDFGRGVVAELLVVRAFAYAGAHAAPPASAVAGFVRTLQLLAQLAPDDAILVPFGDATPEAIGDALRQRDESKSSLFVMPVGVPRAHMAQLTARVPDRVVARRLSLLARASLDVLPDFARALQVTLTDFDYLFRIDKAAARATKARVMFDFDPVRQLVLALRARFGLHALFFYDDARRHVIGVAWRQRKLPAYVTAPLIQEMLVMGGELIKK
jgi:hypothetical protein